MRRGRQRLVGSAIARFIVAFLMGSGLWFRAFSRGGIELPRTRRRGAIATPANRGSLHCCEALFSLLCFGVFHTTIHIRRNSSVVRSTMLFPPMAGCPCRAPAAVSPPRHKARP